MPHRTHPHTSFPASAKFQQLLVIRALARKVAALRTSDSHGLILSQTNVGQNVVGDPWDRAAVTLVLIRVF
jgi:hypothetical protein